MPKKSKRGAGKKSRGASKGKSKSKGKKGSKRSKKHKKNKKIVTTVIPEPPEPDTFFWVRRKNTSLLVEATEDFEVQELIATIASIYHYAPEDIKLFNDKNAEMVPKKVVQIKEDKGKGKESGKRSGRSRDGRANREVKKSKSKKDKSKKSKSKKGKKKGKKGRKGSKSSGSSKSSKESESRASKEAVKKEKQKQKEEEEKAKALEKAKAEEKAKIKEEITIFTIGTYGLSVRTSPFFNPLTLSYIIRGQDGVWEPKEITPWTQPIEIPESVKPYLRNYKILGENPVVEEDDSVSLKSNKRDRSMISK